MFWNKNKKNKCDKRPNSIDKTNAKAGSTGGKHSQGMSSDQIRTQALANARNARANLGDDTIQKITEIMAKKQNNPMEQAKRQIQAADAEKVTDHILDMWEDR